MARGRVAPHRHRRSGPRRAGRARRVRSRRRRGRLGRRLRGRGARAPAAPAAPGADAPGARVGGAPRLLSVRRSRCRSRSRRTGASPRTWPRSRPSSRCGCRSAAAFRRPRAGEVFLLSFLAYALLVPPWAWQWDGHPGNEPKTLRQAVALGHWLTFDAEAVSGPMEELEARPLVASLPGALGTLGRESWRCSSRSRTARSAATRSARRGSPARRSAARTAASTPCWPRVRRCCSRRRCASTARSTSRAASPAAWR